MPKANKHKHKNVPSAGTPYARAPAPSNGATTKSNSIFKMNTDLGQHVLKNPGIANNIVDKANLKQSDIVLEVGPGSGNLTVRILEKAKKCIAFEMDPRMAAETTKRLQGTPAAKRLEIRISDAIKTEFPYHDVCISNTPYQISSPLVMKLLSLPNPPRVAVLMFQNEFGERLLAKAGEKLYSRLSVNVQMWSKCSRIMKVGRLNFNPPPDVESVVVRIEIKNPRPQISFDEWDGLLRVCWVRPNRTLRSTILGTSSILDIMVSNYTAYCATHDIDLPSTSSTNGVAPEVSMTTEEDEWNPAWDDTTDDIPNQHEGDGMDVDDEDDLPEFFKQHRDATKKSKEKGAQRKKRGPVAELVREKVRKVLEDDTKLAEKRARNCDEGDFLKLLLAFNREGIHFS